VDSDGHTFAGAQFEPVGGNSGGRREKCEQGDYKSKHDDLVLPKGSHAQVPLRVGY
jgi:hypothetical protein